MGRCLCQEPLSGAVGSAEQWLRGWSSPRRRLHELASLWMVMPHHGFWPLGPLTLLLHGSDTRPFWVNQLALSYFWALLWLPWEFYNSFLCLSGHVTHSGLPLVHSTPFSAWVSSHAGPKMRHSFIYLECDYQCCQRSKKNGSIDIDMFPCFLKQFTRNNLIIHLPIKEYLLSAYYFPSTF